MIAVDTSVIIAILFEEADGLDLSRRILSAAQAWLPQPAALEAHIVARNHRDGLLAEELTLLLQSLTIRIAPLNDTTHLAEARLGFDRYGKGRSPAKLNFGDCLVYGFAKAENVPLLFKGSDFSKTDITPA